MNNLENEIANEKLTPKLIQIGIKDKEAIEKKAKEYGIKSNQLIRMIIKEYLKKEV